jgi:hypothetical protein
MQFLQNNFQIKPLFILNNQEYINTNQTNILYLQLLPTIIL